MPDFDLLTAEALRINEVVSGPGKGQPWSVPRAPLSMVGTDSTFISNRPSPRTWGSFPRILGEFVRDTGVMTLENAVRKMTGTPSACLGLRHRGLLRDGFKADITIFDPSTVATTATYEEPHSFPIDIDWFIVDGQVVVDAGQHTGATPGRTLRRRDA